MPKAPHATPSHANAASGALPRHPSPALPHRAAKTAAESQGAHSKTFEYDNPAKHALAKQAAAVSNGHSHEKDSPMRLPRSS